MSPPVRKVPAHKYDYDSLQPPGIQWYQFDPALSGNLSAGLEAAARQHPGTPERMTLTRFFRDRYKNLGAILGS